MRLNVLAYTEKRGNLLRLTRKGLTAPGEHSLIDDVTATYNGNQLHTLRDDAPEVLLEASMDVASGTYPSGSFAYDANGNMTCDPSRNITDMEYNALNLPQRITFADGSRIDWLYTSSGEKLRQTVIAATGDTLSRRDYIGSYLFVDNEFDRYQLAEGYITPDDIYHAYIPDYQGNIVGVVNTSSGILEQHTRYYPYGLPFADSSNPTVNRRKYGAKELTPDLGLNAYDFEARTLVPAFPMFIQQDLMAEKYYCISPYLYCAGNPINLVDPDGMDWVHRVYDGVSEYYYDRDVKSQSDVNKKYGNKSGYSYIADGTSVKLEGDTYIFHNDTKENKYGTVDKNGVRQDNSKIIYGIFFNIFGTTDESCDASTLHKNLLGTSYTGGTNPQSYNKEDSYQYIPRNSSEWASMLHDKMYGSVKAEGIDGALFDCRPKVLFADWALVQCNILNACISLSTKDKGRSIATAYVFNIIFTYKAQIFLMQKCNEAFNWGYHKFIDSVNNFFHQ